MFEFNISYTIKEHLPSNILNDMKKVLKHASDVLKLQPKINYFDLQIVGDQKIKSINNSFRHLNKVTDIISLAYNNSSTIFVNVDFNHLGELYLDLAQAKRQAKKYGHSLNREVCFLVLHGLLHLLGYDHLQKEDEEVMFDLQNQILDLAQINR